MIELRQISKSYERPGGGRVNVLEAVSLSVGAGEAVGLSGSSGCGKTTLLNIAAGLLAPDSGQVLIQDTDLYAMGEARRDRFRAGKIGYVFQNFNLIPSLSAWENVMAAMYFGKCIPRSGRAARGRELLEQMGLSGRRNHRPDQLSGGEQQRVCIARALANRPPVLFADEPTANLDSENRRQVTRLLLEACRRERVTLLAATHDPELLAALPRVIQIESVRPEDRAAALACCASLKIESARPEDRPADMREKAERSTGNVI